MRKGYIKNIIFILILSFIMLFNVKDTHASGYTMNYDDNLSIYGNYTFTYKGRTLSSHREWARRPIIANGQKVFCLDVFNEKIGPSYTATEFRAGTVYNQFGDVLTEEQLYKIKKIIFWGWAMNDWTAKNYFYTQIYVWETCGYNLVSLSDAFSMSEYNSFKKVIENHMSKTTSFNGNTYQVRLGESLTLTDTNGNLQYLEFVDKNGWEITQNGNTITFKPTKAATECTLNTRNFKLFKYSKTNIVLWDGVHQQTVLFRDPDYIKANINLVPIKYDKIKIYKMGEDGKVVPYTKFITSYNEDFSGETWTYETGEDGYTREIDGWDVDKTVYVKELEVPAPYVISSEVQKVTIVGGQTHTFTFTNELIKGRVEINKEDSEIKGLKIPNVKFGIYDENNTLVEELTTDENGYAISSLIKYGDYTLKEISTNDNYILSDKVIDIQIREHKKTYTYNIVNDAIKGKLQIVKIDSKDVERPVAGAVFDIVAEDVFGVKKGTVVDTITTDKNGFAFTKDLRKGRYYAVEKYVSDAYLLNNSKYHINILENAKLEVIRIKNEPVELRLRVIKYDENTKEKKVIEGTVFKIVNADTKEDVEFTEFVGIRPIKRVEFTTDENGEIVLPQTLRAGNYKLVEVKAAKGYKGIEDIAFSVDRNTKYEEIELLGKVNTISVGNERIKANLKLIKVDKNTKERLKGVTFKIKGIDGFMKGEEFEVTTDENGEVTLEGLYYGKYSIKEIKGAAGYLEYDKEIEFDVEEDNKEIVIEIENEKIPEIISKATGERGEKEIYETEKIKEVVEISNLIKGNTYKIIAKMINKATGEVISVQEREFTASGETERLEFIFNAKGLSGKTIVMTDELYKDGKIIANHTDLTNKEQTVKIKEKPIPKTGVDSKMILYISLMSISVFSLMVLIRKREK